MTTKKLTFNPVTKGSIYDAPNNIYYNIQLTNDVVYRKSTTAIPAKYEATLTNAIVDDPSKYYVAISRFQLPGDAIPIARCPIQPATDPYNNTTNANLSTIGFVLSYGGFQGTAWLNFYTTNLFEWSTSSPPPPSASHPRPYYEGNSYYFIYSYQHMIDMMNIALSDAFTDLGGKVALPGGSVAPHFFFDEKTQLISLYCQKAFYPDSLANPISVGWNVSANQYLIGFPIYFVSNIDIVGGNPNECLRLIIDDTIINEYDATHLAVAEEYVGIQYWNVFQNIVFTSQSLPIQREFVPTNPVTIQGPGTPSSLGIITDFQPDLSSAGDARSELQFVQIGSQRVVDLLSTTPITHIDIQVWWSDNLGILYPILISSNLSMSIKLMFIKKDSYVG